MNVQKPGVGKWPVGLMQVLLWAVFYLLLLLYTSHKWDHPLFGFWNATIATLSYIIATYTHAFWLLPRFLYRNQKKTYIALSFLFLAVLVLTRMSVEKAVLLPIHKMFYAFRWAHISFTCITLLVAFLFGALLRVLLNYIHLLRAKKELQEQHAAAELNLLKAQVQPHFLFNTLNNIYSLAQSGSSKTPEMIAKLSELMRYFLDDAPKPRLPVSTELQFIRNYIDLEQIRMLHPVQVHWEVDENVLRKEISPMLLMPFVENVFKHGINKMTSENAMAIHLRAEGEGLSYRVTNSYCEENGAIRGSGLANLEKRLSLLYGNSYRIYTGKEKGHYIAQLNLPG